MSQVYKYSPSKFHRLLLPALTLVGGAAFTAYSYFQAAGSDKQIEVTLFLGVGTLLLTYILYWRYTQVIEIQPDKVVLYRAGKITHELPFDQCVFRAMIADYTNPIAPGMDCTLVVRRNGEMGEKHPVYLPKQQFREIFAVITAMQLNFTGGVEPDGTTPVERAPESQAAFVGRKKQIPAKTYVTYPERAVERIYKIRRIVTWYIPGFLGIAAAIILHELPNAYALPPLLAILSGVLVFLIICGIQQMISRQMANKITTGAPNRIFIDSQGLTLGGKKALFDDIRQIIATPGTVTRNRLDTRHIKIILKNQETLDYCLGLRDDDEDEQNSSMPHYSEMIGTLHKLFTDQPGTFMFHI